MSKKVLLLAASMCAISSHMTANNEVALPIDSLLPRIELHNADLRSSRARHAADLQGIEVARAARLPQIDASLQLSYLGDGTILDRDFSNAMRDKLPHFSNSLSVNLYQPVYHGGAISAGIQLATETARLSAIAIDQQRDASMLQVLDAYFNLLKMRNLRQVLTENIALTEQLIEHMQARHEQGTVLENDITRYRLRLSNLTFDLQCVDNTISVLNLNLVTLLGYSEGTILAPSSTSDITSTDMATEDYWQSLTAMHSTDLQSIDISRDIANASLDLARAEKLPSVGIVIGDQLSGPVTFEIPAIDKNYNAWYAGVSISYNISSLFTTNKKVKQKKLEIVQIDDARTALSDALIRRVHQAYTDMLQASQALNTEQVNVRLANENYAVIETRYNNEMALLTDMLDASTAKLDAETRLVNARISLMLAYYQMRYISGTLTMNL